MAKQRTPDETKDAIRAYIAWNERWNRELVRHQAAVTLRGLLRQRRSGFMWNERLDRILKDHRTLRRLWTCLNKELA